MSTHEYKKRDKMSGYCLCVSGKGSRIVEGWQRVMMGWSWVVVDVDTRPKKRGDSSRTVQVSRFKVAWYGGDILIFIFIFIIPTTWKYTIQEHFLIIQCA